MAQKTKIEWTDKTWNPVTGCTKVSQGCKNCYAERLYERFNGKNSFKNVICHPERLNQPLSWRKPAMVFVNSMSDLFHEDVPFYFIYDVFRTMCIADKHIFQVLTKRADRMLEFFEQYAELKNPIDNIWIGVSVEDQKAAHERILKLLQVPASVRFLSCEPLLGPVDLTAIKQEVAPGFFGDCLGWHHFGKSHFDEGLNYPSIDWVIAGGESGPGARAMHPDWAKSLRDQCAYAGVSFFFKQWGDFAPLVESSKEISFAFNDGTLMQRMGKKKTGRLLDGKEYSEFPKINKESKQVFVK